MDLRRILPLLFLGFLGIGCASAEPSVKLDRSITLTRKVTTVYLHPLENTTGNEEAGRLVESALRHRLEFSGFRIAEPELSAGAILGGGGEAEADLTLKPTLTLVTTSTDKVNWFPMILHPVGWALMVGDASIKNNVVAVQVDALIGQGEERMPVVARGFIEQKRLDLLPGVGAVSGKIAEKLVAEIQRASNRVR